MTWLVKDGAPPLLPPQPAVARRAYWVIAVMAWLMALALTLTISLDDAADRWSGDLAGRLTIQVVDADPARRDVQVQAAVAMLQTFPGVAKVDIVPGEEVERLLEPWLGRNETVASLPVPALIELTTGGAGRFDLGQLKSRLATIVPGARLDDYGGWRRRLQDLGLATRLFGVAVLLLVAGSAAAVIGVTTRSGLAQHQDAISLLHLLGAGDGVIAHQVQLHFFRQGLLGGTIGAAAALLTLIGFQHLATRVGGGLIGSAQLNLGMVLAMILLPPALGGLSLLVARVTVLRSLSTLS